MKKILVVDDHPTVREGTKAILQSEGRYQVSVLSPPYDKETIAGTDFSNYDLIMMDMSFGETDNGITLSKVILEKLPEMRIVLYTGYDVCDYWDEALRAGIYGVINKSESIEVVMNYLEQVFLGNLIAPFKLYRNLIENINKEQGKYDNGEMALNISEREVAILGQVAIGLTNQDIADKLHLSKRSIEYSLSNLYTKLGVSTRTEAILIAKSEGLIA